MSGSYQKGITGRLPTRSFEMLQFSFADAAITDGAASGGSAEQVNKEVPRVPLPALMELPH